jgi:hypothetical protein
MRLHCAFLVRGKNKTLENTEQTIVSSTTKTDRHDITEILLKVALSTITHTHIKEINALISQDI